MKPVMVKTVFGGGLRLKAGVDAFEARYGALVEFLDEDGTIRDFDGLERVEAAVLGLGLCDLAQHGLSPQGQQAVMEQALELLSGAGSNIFHFPTSSRSAKVPGEGPTGGYCHNSPPVGIGEELTVDSGQLTAKKNIAKTAVPHSSDAPAKCTCGEVIHSYRPIRYKDKMLNDLAAKDPLAAEMLWAALQTDPDPLAWAVKYYVGKEHVMSTTHETYAQAMDAFDNSQAYTKVELLSLPDEEVLAFSDGGAYDDDDEKPAL